MAFRPSTTVTILAVAAMVLAGCQNETSAGAPASAADKGAPASAPGKGAPTSAAGKGIAALPAEEILRRARTALRQAKSFAAEGKLYGTYATVKNSQSQDVKIEVIGKDYHESIQFDAYELEVLSVGGQVYIKGDEEFWNSLPIIVSGDKRRWIKMGNSKEAFAGDNFRGLDIDAMFKLKGPFTKDTSGANDSEPWVSINDASGPRLYVSATDQAYPQQVNPANGTVLSFEGFGDDFVDIIQKPPASQIDDTFYKWTQQLDH